LFTRKGYLSIGDYCTYYTGDKFSISTSSLLYTDDYESIFYVHDHYPLLISVFLMHFEHFLECAGLLALRVLALLAFAEVSAVHPLLETLAVLLLAKRLPAIATLEMSLFLISYCQSPNWAGFVDTVNNTSLYC